LISAGVGVALPDPIAGFKGERKGGERDVEAGERGRK